TITKVTQQLLIPHLNHPYQQVRELIALLLTFPLTLFWQPKRDEISQLPVLSKELPAPHKYSSELLQAIFKQYESLPKSELKTVNNTLMLWIQNTYNYGIIRAIIPN